MRACRGSAEWYYGWVPFFGGLTGGAIAGGLTAALASLIE